MYCPKCKSDIRCGCESCRNIHGNKPSMLCVYGEIGECPMCGFSTHVDQWLDIEYDQMLNKKANKQEN